MPAVDRMLTEKEYAIQVIKEQLTRVQHRMKQLVDKNRMNRTFQIGDMVFLKLHLYK